ncbi:MAG: AraC family transcriptional regulator [Lapillicoccus sp.]
MAARTGSGTGVGERLPTTSSHAGILRPEEFARYATLTRTAPGPEVAPWVEWCWSVTWDLPDGASYQSAVVPHPALHLTVEWGTGRRHGFPLPAALLHGIVTTRFDIGLRGTGGVAGVKFRPGGFGAFTGLDVATTLGSVVDLSEFFGSAADALRANVIRADADTRHDLLEAFLRVRVPGPDPRYDLVLDVVADMLADRSLTRVEQVTERHGIPLRTLQRLFRRYVGVGPKWALQRYRLHDAVALIDAGQVDDLSGLAASLGWYDQAHFTKEFTALVGLPPARYAARHTDPSGQPAPS